MQQNKQTTEQNAQSKSFELLDKRIQSWVWRHEWREFRHIQEAAIPVILNGERDVILSASTSSGKTEAAFLPIITKMLSNENPGLIVYISPLISLINDQLLRITELCDRFDIPVYPWHGGINASVKKKFFAKPEGILLITIESLQAIFCNHGFEVYKLFCNTLYIVIDEMHCFIGSERGKQLQTLLHFLDIRTKKIIKRIGLSATLGDMQVAKDFLSGAGDASHKCILVEDKNDKIKIKLLLKGIVENKEIEPIEPAVEGSEKNNIEHDALATFSAPHAIAEYLFEKLRGTNNLIFPNSRAKVEYYSHLLSTLCYAHGVPNEFFAHHGNLAKEIREDAEDALRSSEHSANVICTSTMEMGIDIGEIASVVQLESPPSVASLRQRVGRSGRREGSVSILRGFTIESELRERSHLFSQLRESTFQFCAALQLLLEGWNEPPIAAGMHLSTLIQQILALIAERGGIEKQKAYSIVCIDGPFGEVCEDDFSLLVAHLKKENIIESANHLLLLQDKGERLVSRHTFFAAFTSEIEYRIVDGEKTLGTLPVNSSLQAGDFIIFAGRTWKIKRIEDSSRIIEVKFFAGGRPPVFSGSAFSLHTRIREKMKELYESEADIPFADTTAKGLIAEGRHYYKKYDLSNPDNMIIERGTDSILFTVLGDRENRTLVLLLKYLRASCYSNGMAITVHNKSKKELLDLLLRLRDEEFPKSRDLLKFSQNLFVEKWDKLLPPTLLIKNYESLYLSPKSVKQWLKNIKL